MSTMSQNYNVHVSALYDWINQKPIPLRNLYFRVLRESPEYASFEALIEQAIIESSEEEGSKLIPASKSSIEALEEVITVDGDIDTTCSCTICMDNLVNGSQVSSMPCSHKFHNTCIVSWLEKSHVCPLCRFELPTME